MIQRLLPFFEYMKRQKLSERVLAQESALSRGSVRGALLEKNVTIKSLEQVASFFDCDLHLLATPQQVLSQYSTIATSLLVERDGFDSWKIHFFNFVDEFRRTLDVRLIMLPPHSGFDKRLTALLSSIVRDVTQGMVVDTPSWALKRNLLDTPWFVSEMESLKASALLESPIFYRANNIFVHENFLQRA